MDSIKSVNELALFAGTGGGILGGVLRGWRTVCAVEIEAYCRAVLCARQNDGALVPFPIWDDVRTFDGRPWRGIVDVVSGGFPCQDISAAGKGVGIGGSRSGLWREMHRIIGEVRPPFAFMENSPMLTSRGLGRVLGDLVEIGYDAEWMCLSAADCGAPHRRERIWILARDRMADSEGERRQEQALSAESCGGPRQGAAVGVHPPSDATHDGNVRRVGAWGGAEGGTTRELRESLPDPTCDRHRQGREVGNLRQEDGRPDGELFPEPPESGWWSVEPALGRVAHGVAHRVDRLKAIGNGQVPVVAARAFGLLMQRFIDAEGGAE